MNCDLCGSCGMYRAGVCPRCRGAGELPAMVIAERHLVRLLVAASSASGYLKRDEPARADELYEAAQAVAREMAPGPSYVASPSPTEPQA